MIQRIIGVLLCSALGVFFWYEKHSNQSLTLLIDAKTGATMSAVPYQHYVNPRQKVYQSNPSLLKIPPAEHRKYYHSVNHGELSRFKLNAISRYYGLPDDLLFYQSKVESSGRCEGSTSHAGAVGCFQFMAATAQDFSLIKDNKDYRTNLYASADAAARYMLWLSYLLYGDASEPSDWEQLRHVLAAYNAGHTRVKGKRGIRIPTFYETIRYVITIENLVKRKAVWVKRGDSLASISKRTSVPVRALLRGNLGVTSDQDLRAETVLSLPDAAGMTRVVVKRGMSLYQISHRTGIPVEQVADVNGIGESGMIRVGEILRLPATGR